MTTYIGRPDDLGTVGPLIAVRLAVPKELPFTSPPLETLARIDTGYPYNLIQEGVATQLGLTPYRKAAITTPTKYIYWCDVYRIRIEFPSGHAVQLEAAEVPYIIELNVKIDCILGRGSLSVCVFTYDGPSDTFTLEYKW